MNFEEIYKKSQKELEDLRVQKMALQQKIEEAAKELGLDPTQDLNKQVVDLKAKLEQDLEGYNNELSKLVTEIEAQENV